MAEPAPETVTAADALAMSRQVMAEAEADRVALDDGERTPPDDTAKAFEGHDRRECGEHRTVGPHRAWCLDCRMWCYPRDPCVGCKPSLPDDTTEGLRERMAKIRENDKLVHRLHGSGWDDHATDAEIDRADLLAIIGRYENALSWQTSCLACAKVLDSSIAEHERAIEEHDRADKAEAEVERLRAELTEARNVIRRAYEFPNTNQTVRMLRAAALDAPETPGDAETIEGEPK
jgi:hypothetical protein